MSTNPRSGLSAGFSQFPRWAAAELEDGHLTPGEFILLAYLCVAGADCFGISVTHDALARTVGLSTRTTARALAKLKENGLVTYEVRRGQRRPFRVTAGPRLKRDSLLDADPSDLAAQRTRDDVAYDLTYDVKADVDHPVDDVGDDVAAGPIYPWESEAKALSPPALDDVADDVFETETETQKRTSSSSISDEEIERLLDHRWLTKHPECGACWELLEDFNDTCPRCGALNWWHKQDPEPGWRRVPNQPHHASSWRTEVVIADQRVLV